ncbi:MAG: hypothetical protein APF78_01365 [Sphingomonadales bacterium BRH_c3]|nr:MAG: hypothetical protein APF78_01365 [Sphingomonadales bacterium BRH_c3]
MRGAGHHRWTWLKAGALLAPVAMIGGCISIEAPDKPIVIELNINIRQEVVYMLAEDAAETIEENADIF